MRLLLSRSPLSSSVIKNVIKWTYVSYCPNQLNNLSLYTQARVQGGGGQGAWAPPPLEIEKQKKKKKKRSSEQILSYFTYILLLFLSKISFSQLFYKLGPPLKN